MGNPVITRLGINQFWYKHWYADNFYSQTLQEDALLTTLVPFYLNHAAAFKTNPFLHEYWYKNTFKSMRIERHQYRNLQNFRKYSYTNTRLGIEHSYLIRYKTGEYFPMRLWVMRYSGWVFLSVSWFKPIKSKRSQTISSKKKLVGSVFRARATTSNFKRLALVHQFISSHGYSNTQYGF